MTDQNQAREDNLGLHLRCIDGEWYIQYTSRDSKGRRITRFLLVVNANPAISQAQQEFIATTCYEALKKTSWGETPILENTS